MIRLTQIFSFVAVIVCMNTSWAQEGEITSPLIDPFDQAFAAAMAKNGVEQKFDAHRAFGQKLFEDCRGEKKFKDKTGNCRLQAVESLVTKPQFALLTTEIISSRIMAQARLQNGLRGLIMHMRTLTSVETGEITDDPANADKTREQLQEIATAMAKIEQAKTSETLDLVVMLLSLARAEQSRSIAPLTADELLELRSSLFPQTTGDLKLGHRFADAAKGRRTADLLEKMDRVALSHSAGALASLSYSKCLAALARIETNVAPTVAGAGGKLLQELKTPHGTILVGGPEANEYNLDELADIAVVIDHGGNDTYIEGTTTEKRPVLVVIDLAGDDTYRGTKPGIQGSAILGVSMLIDQAGNDTYTAADVAQGSALGGVGILIDNADNDTYVGDRRAQGQATGGFGLLLDRAGDDKYRAALLAQGVGGPLGVGVLIDLAGADHYFAGGKYPGGYDDTPGFGGWSQGVGVGPRGVANGGIGMILDGGGDDIYEADYFSHGGGYWFAAGVARDFGGNDQRLGATRENFDGTPRTEPRFVRWGTGYGCHYAAGFVIDDAGNDTYQADFAVISYAWDIAVAGICDLAGNDKYITQGSGVCQAHNSAVAFLYDKSGNDVYQGGIGATTEVTDYHPEGGSGNYTFLLDEAGEDQYGHDLKNGQEQLRGWGGAILIDKP